MTVQNELDTKNAHRTNVVIEINGTFFSKHQVDADSGDLIGTGSGVPSANLGLVSMPKTNPIRLDLTKVKTSINTTTFIITDKQVSKVFSTFIGNSDDALIGQDVTIYFGFVGVSMDFSEYVKSNYVITNITQTGLAYTLSATSKRDRFQVPTFNQSGYVQASITASSTSVTVTTGTDKFQSTGGLKISDEFMTYTGKSFSAGNTTFTGLTRGLFGSTAVAHGIGENVLEVTEVQENIITLLLQIILSGSGHATYDVLHDGLGIDPADIDITSIENIRTNFFPTRTVKFQLFDIQNTLQFLEQELLQSINSRFIDTLSGISIAVLDQSVPGAVLNELNKTNLRNTKPVLKMNANRIINQVEIFWDYEDGTDTYKKISFFEDTDSQAKYGIRQNKLIYKFKGIKDSLSGSSIVQDIADRLLARFSTPQVQIDVTGMFKTYAIVPGEKVFLTHPDVLMEGGALGISTELEVIAKSINYKTGDVKLSLAYTSYRNTRRGLIAPCKPILTVTSQKQFTVVDVTHYQAGYFLKLYDKVTNTFYADAANEIESVDESTNTIVMKNNFTTTLATDGDMLIRFADYDDSSELQKARFAYISPNSGFFGDGKKGYQIAI